MAEKRSTPEVSGELSLANAPPVHPHPEATPESRVRADSRIATEQDVEDLKTVLIDQMQMIGELAQRLLEQVDGRFDREVVDDAISLNSFVGNCEPHLKVLLADYDIKRRPTELQQLQSNLRHEIAGKLNDPSGRCQILRLRLPEDSAPARAVEELQLAISQFTNNLDLLVGGKGVDRQTTLGPATKPPLARTRSAPQVRPARVLIAEDNPVDAQILVRFLASFNHHDVVTVTSGSDALRALKRSDFDLVLLDVMMPVMNGIAVLRKMKDRHSPFQHIPVIMVSGHADEQRAVACIDAGAEDYVTKPINLVLLAARVRSCLARSQMYKQHLRHFFSTALSDRLYKDLVGSDDLLSAEVLKTREKAEISVLFCDIRRFSAISAKVGATTTVEWVRSVMEELAWIVDQYQGVVIDIIGDELMVMWGAPEPDRQHADLAIQAGLDLVDAADRLNVDWVERLGEPFRIGVGINSGEAHVGIIGPKSKFKYGPLGPTVNLASRVQGVTKHLKSSLLVTEHTKRYLQDGGRITARRLCTGKLVNIADPVRLYEVRRREEDSKPREIFATYQRALRMFQRREFRSAARLLGSIVAGHEDDGPSQLLMSRVLRELVKDDERGFDSVWNFTSK